MRWMGAALLYRSVMRCCTARRAARAGGRKGSSWAERAEEVRWGFLFAHREAVRVQFCGCPADVRRGAPSWPRARRRRRRRADARGLQPGGAHLPSRLSPCVWNERRAAAVSGRSGAARRRSAIREYQPHSGRGGIKPTADQLSASPEGRAEGQNLVVCSSCCCWAAFFFFFFNELTYHERKKWIRGAFISSCDPSFTSLTGDSHSYIHSTCRFGCSELEKPLCMQQTWLASRIQASLKSVSNTYWNPGAIVSSGRVIFSYYALLAE